MLMSVYRGLNLGRPTADNPMIRSEDHSQVREIPVGLLRGGDVLTVDFIVAEPLNTIHGAGDGIRALEAVEDRLTMESGAAALSVLAGSILRLFLDSEDPGSFTKIGIAEILGVTTDRVDVAYSNIRVMLEARGLTP